MAIPEAEQPTVRAAALTMARDEIWRNPPPLAEDCEHDLECLPVIEFRQTVICRKCGGLDIRTSRLMTSHPGIFPVAPDGSVRPVAVTVTSGRHYEDAPLAPTEIRYG